MNYNELRREVNEKLKNEIWKKKNEKEGTVAK